MIITQKHLCTLLLHAVPSPGSDYLVVRLQDAKLLDNALNVTPLGQAILSAACARAEQAYEHCVADKREAIERKPYDPPISEAAVTATPPGGWFKHLLWEKDFTVMHNVVDIWRRGFTYGQELMQKAPETVKDGKSGGFTGGFRKGQDPLVINVQTTQIPVSEILSLPKRSKAAPENVEAGQVWYARFRGGLSGTEALHLIRLTEVTDERVSYQSWDDWRAYREREMARHPGNLYPAESFPLVAHYMRRSVTFVERLELPDGE